MCDIVESAYLTEDQQQQLRAYSYAGSDNSLLLRLYRPVLEWWVEKVPLFTSPNLITLMGFLSVNSAAVVTLFYSMDMKEPLPRGVYFYNGLAIWAYQWLDNLDGKQARRTKTSSAFGELFDHGVDAYAATSATICFNAALQLGPTPLSILTPFLVYFPFFFATWEQFWLGSMDLGMINGAMEGIFSLVLIMFAGAIFGPEMYTANLAFERTVGECMCFAGLILCAGCVLWNTWAVSSFLKKSRASLVEALKQCVPLWILLFSALIYTSGTEESAASGNDDALDANHVALGYILVNGFIFGHVGTNITLAHLSKVRFPWFFAVLAFPLVLVLTFFCNEVLRMALPVAGMVWISVALLCIHTTVYKTILIQSLLTTLGINFLTLTSDQKNRLVSADSPV